MSASTELQKFSSALSFVLDDFQLRACAALEDGHGVLVCAPTGAGKTVVGEFAVHLAISSGHKCFYTTPIKALSNQKYAELTQRYGKSQVGLLTGDSSINSDAPIVVMTTEVLRNMLYATSDALQGLSHVVMDEVHFLADRFRGAVWEEVILHLDPEVRLVSLSATVSNAEEFGAWMETVRGNTTVIVDETRPIPLWQHILVGRRLFDLFDKSSSNPTSGSSKIVVDSELTRYVKHRLTADRMNSWQSQKSSRSSYSTSRRRESVGGRPVARPLSRPEVIAKLDDEGLLPAITFIFSRAGCDAAIAQCLRSPLRLTTAEQTQKIRQIVDRHIADLPPNDLDVLGYWEWREGLERGLAAHHAGMLPVFRHAVEELFLEGLVRAVFATETLALGINMPARTVVLERLVKFNGETHAELTAGEYTQLTGRAGRRGIDVEGHAVVLWQPGVEPSEVAGLASTRTFPLKSSFMPSYNMTINLVNRMGIKEARSLLDRSFAQFQADKSVVGLSRRIVKAQTAADDLLKRLGGSDSPFFEYISLRERIKSVEQELERKKRSNRRDQITTGLATLKRGDVVAITYGRRAGLAVIVEPDSDPQNPRPVIVTINAWSGRVSASDFFGPADPLGSIRLPRHNEYRKALVRKDIAASLRNSGIPLPGRRQQGKRTSKNPTADERELETLRRSLRAHPSHKDPAKEHLNKLADRYLALNHENNLAQLKISAATNSLARTFDRIVSLLHERGYLEWKAARSGYRVTTDGSALARIYCESDLLVSECLRQEAWVGLSPAELAAVVSCAVFETRGDSDGAPLLSALSPTRAISEALTRTQRLWEDLRNSEIHHKIAPSREPDYGFVRAMYKWASKSELSTALVAAGQNGQPLPAGDFVRWCRQVIDLLDQVQNAAPDVALRRTALKAIAEVRRGVVAVEIT
ncbi:MAG: DEAD/DEAH box helicase [Mycobacteriaceae bacterium]